MRHPVIRLALALTVALAAVIFGNQLPAGAACGTLPYTFTDNVSTVAASTTNTNNAFLLACATQVDATQIGVTGIYPSQILGSSQATATFGGNYGLRIMGTSTSYPQLAIFGASGNTVDLFQVWTLNGGTKALWVDSSGVPHVTSLIAGPVTATSVASGSTVNGPAASNTQNDTVFERTNGRIVSTTRDGGTAATSFGSMLFGGPAYAGNIDWQESNANAFSLRRTDSGNYVPLMVGNSATAGYVSPTYQATGAATGANQHTVQGTVASAGTSGTGVTLSANAAFASLNSYVCNVTWIGATPTAVSYTPSSGNLFYVYSAVAGNVSYICTGV